jgi:hypothetical protein
MATGPVPPKNNEKALSEVIGFILLLGVVVAAFALWSIYVVPANGRESEISQMNAVKDRFTDYKFSLDSLWINNQTSATVSTSINLGTGGGNTAASGLFLPLLNPIASSATISVNNTGDTMWVNTSNSGQYALTLNTLEYQSQNYYWIQQRYYYQAGGVFLSQSDGSTCRVSPPFSFIAASTTTGTPFALVKMEPIQLIGGSTVGGNGPVRIDSYMRTPANPLVLNPDSFVKVSVNTTSKNTADTWIAVFNDTAVRGSLPVSWYTSKIVLDPATNRWNAYINITGPLSTPNPVRLTYQSADYVVTLNNIASGIT